MFFSGITDSGSMPGLVKAMEFAEARMKVIAENVANLHTPGYQAKSLDVRGFQHALREAFDARGVRPGQLFVEDDRELATDDDGRLQVTPSTTGTQNILFHDGTNLSIERQMSDLAETALMHEMAAALLKGGVDRMRAAIRGTVG